MATYTIAQALASSASGITVADSAVDIASALPNPALVSRVTLFTMNGSGAVAAWQAAALAGLGSQFSTSGYKLTVRDSVAGLTDPANASGLTIPGIVVAVYDTAIDILNAASNTIIRNASSIALSANATVSLNQLLTLESWPSFTAAGLTITLADSAANLLALTTAEQKPTLTVFQVSVNSTVNTTQAIALAALSHFSVVGGATLTVADSITDLINSSAALSGLLALPYVVVNVSDTVTDLLGQTSQLTTIRSTMPVVAVSLSDSETINVSQAAALAALAGFSLGTGHTLSIADTVLNLVTLTTAQAALAQAITLKSNDTANLTQLVTLAALAGFSAGSGHVLTIADTVAHLVTVTTAQAALAQASTLLSSDSATVAQLIELAALPAFVPGTGHVLTLTDNIADLATLNSAQRALASTTTVDDTVTDILNALAAHSTVLSGATAVTAELDGTSITVAQLTSLMTLPGLTLHPNTTSSTQTIADSVQDLVTLTTAQKALIQATTLLANDTANATQLAQLAALPAFSRGSGHTLVVTDTVNDLAALTTAQHALASSITVDDTVTDILNALTAHSTVLSGASIVTAELDGSSITVAQLTSLMTLPGLTLHPNATSSTLTVTDSVQDLVTLTTAQKALIQATTLLANDTANATQLAQLAALPAFSRGAGHTLVVTDTVNDLAALTTAQQALATGTTVDDTVTDILSALTAHSTVLSGATAVTAELDGTSITVAQLTSLMTLPGLTLHPNTTSSTQTIADSVQDLVTLTTAQKALIQATTLLASDTANATQLEQLAALPAFSRGSGHTLVVTDNISDLGGLSTAQHALASSTTVDDTVTDILNALAAHSTVLSGASIVTAELDGTSITVAQLTSLMTLPGLTLHPNATSSTLTVTDSVQDLVTLTTAQKALIQATTLLANDTANATQLAQLAALPAFSRGAGHTLVVTDTVNDLAALTTAQRALATGTTVDDTVTDILSALTAHSTVLSGASIVIAELDGVTLNAPEAIALASITGLRLHSNATASTLTISDTMQALAGAAAALTTLDGDGPVTVTPNNDHTILTASSAASLIAAGLSPANYTLAVADTGSQLSAFASQIFGVGFETITVTSGTFAGTLAQLLDPTLHFMSAAAAQLAASATGSATQAVALSVLPGFSLGTGATLAVQDTIAKLVLDTTALQQVASSVTATDSGNCLGTVGNGPRAASGSPGLDAFQPGRQCPHHQRHGAGVALAGESWCRRAFDRGRAVE